MRVTTELWVSALVRRVFGDGGYAAIVRRGATEAGAVFITERTRSGDYVLYGPAPQTSYDEAGPGERRFVEVRRFEDETGLTANLERETRFDPDIWVVEIEPGAQTAADLLAIRTP